MPHMPIKLLKFFKILINVFCFSWYFISICHLPVVFQDQCQNYKYKKQSRKILRQSSSSMITQLGSVAFDCGRLYFERQIFHRNKVDGQFLSYYLLSSEEIDKIYFGSDFDSAGWIQISLTTLTKLTPPKRVSIFHRNNVTGQFLIRNW